MQTSIQSQGRRVVFTRRHARRYVAAVRAAADKAACAGYLLAGTQAASMGAKCTAEIPTGFPDDWAALVNAAIASNVCNQPGDGGKCNPAP